ncbi:MAG: glycosyltransferase [Acidobacteriota bacterium]|nr:glycosyltransferase [Acidobacteriota bacterium]
MPPSVSVVIPAYNNSRHLSHAVQSVREQGHSDLEIIVIDDGSTDNTVEVLEQLRGSDLRSIKQANAGPAAARNLGIAEARGEWIAFLDADDYWLPGKLSAQFDALQQQDGADFCYTDALLRFPDGHETISGARNSGGDLFSDLLWGNQLATGTVLVRRRCLAAVGPFNVNLRTGEDWDMWLRLASRFESVYLARVLTCCRAPAHRAHKYGLAMLEECTLAVIDQVFERDEERPKDSDLVRDRLYGWHCAVLAKSYLRYGHWGDFYRLARRTLRSHSAGWSYLLPTRLASHLMTLGSNNLPTNDVMNPNSSVGRGSA